jgi:C-terminal processing protease CtpA/Prc
MYRQLSRTHHALQGVVVVAIVLGLLVGATAVHAVTTRNSLAGQGSLNSGVVPRSEQQSMQKEISELPYTGVTYQPITPQIVEEHSLDTTQGDMLSEVASDSPAAKAGLKADDVIIAVDGQSVDDDYSLTAALIGHVPGDIITLKVERGGAISSVKLTLGVDPFLAPN